MDKTEAQARLTQAQTLHRAGDNAGARAAITPVVKAYPNPAIWDLYGDILLGLGDIAAATQAYRTAVQSEPGNAGYHHDLARALLAGKKTAEAEAALHTAARLNASAWDIQCDLGSAQLEQGKSAEALASFTAALRLNPSAAAAHFNQGTVLRDLGRLEEAEAAFLSAARLSPTFVQPMIALITLMGDTGRLAAALEWHAAAVRIAPQDPQVHQARAMALLRHGALRDGFAAYETRLQPTPLTPPPRPFHGPQWQGEDIGGKRILIWTEQGVGDEIFAAGMFPDMIGAAGAVAIECTERIAPLFRRSFPEASVVVRRDPPDPALQAFDYQTASLSPARFLRSDMARFPAHGGYLRPDRDLVDTLRRKYRALKPGALVVGVSWDSTGRHGVPKRLPLDHWDPILAQKDVLFVSLQYGARPDTPGIQDLLLDPDIDALKDMDTAAAQVAAMDLVITVSNTTAHLAGAMNIPVWTLLPDGPGCLWYWFRDRADSPWYPSMRLFRQPRRGDWSPVIDAAARALVELKAKGRV